MGLSSQALGVGEAREPGPPLPGPARPHFSAGTLPLEPDQLPRAHDWLLTDRNLKSRKCTRMPHYWLGDWQDIWSNEKLGYYCGPDFPPRTGPYTGPHGAITAQKRPLPEPVTLPPRRESMGPMTSISSFKMLNSLTEARPP